MCRIYDIGAVLLPGQLWSQRVRRDSNRSAGNIRNGRYLRLRVPLRWVTQAMQQNNDETVLLPVPQWE